MTIADALAGYLELEGCRYIFGIPGGQVASMLKTLKNGGADLQLIITRHEGGAAFMADGYSRISGRLGAVLTTAGPGATNALTGLASAHRDGSSVLLISGQTSTNYFARGGFQDSHRDGIDIITIFDKATGYSNMIDGTGSFETTVHKALRIAMGTPRQAVHLSLPLDIGNREFPDFKLPNSTAEYRWNSRPIDRDRLLPAFRAFLDARAPLMILGSGMREWCLAGGWRKLAELCNRFCIPVITSPRAKGIFPDSHPMSLGTFGVAGSMQADFILQSNPPDVLLALGTSFSEWGTKAWSSLIKANSRFIQVDIDPEVPGRAYRITDGIHSDAGAAIDLLTDELTTGRITPNPAVEDMAARRRRTVAGIRARVSRYASPSKRNSNDAPITPQRLMKELSGVAAERETNVFADIGNVMGWAPHYMEIDPPSQLHIPLGFASMGWAISASIGGRLARPDVASISVSGDGAFLMNGTEISTAARYKAGVVSIILADGYYLMIEQGMALLTEEFIKAGVSELGRYGIGDVDYRAMAQALGADARTVDDPNVLAESLRAACDRADSTNQPQVLVVPIDTREVPPYAQRIQSIAKQN